MTNKIKFLPTNEFARAFPPEPLKKNLPDWYKNISARIEKLKFTAEILNKTQLNTTGTIKRCVPVLDFMTSGYLLKFHSDILIDPLKIGDFNSFEYRHPGNTHSVGTHAFDQCPVSINNEKNDYIKFNNFWVVKTPPGYSCLFVQPFNLENGNFKLIPAIVDTDTFDGNINFPGIVLAKETFLIKAGDPMMAVFPFKRDKWEMEIEETIKQPGKFHILANQMFENVYRNFFHSKKQYD